MLWEISSFMLLVRNLIHFITMNFHSCFVHYTYFFRFYSNKLFLHYQVNNKGVRVEMSDLSETVSRTRIELPISGKKCQHSTTK